MEFNVEGKSYDELCNITRMRAAEIGGIIIVIKNEIEANHEPYSFTDEKDGEQRHGLVKGKCLAKFFEVITDTQERYVVMFAFDKIMEDMCQTIARVEAKKRLRGGIREALEELFGTTKKEQESK